MDVRVVVVGAGHGVGIGESERVEKEVKFNGEKVVVKP
jgi:hypothetical protein